MNYEPMNSNALSNQTLSRRNFLLGGTSFLGASALPYCYAQTAGGLVPQGAIREIALEARPAEIEIAPGRTVTAWTYNGKFPGPEIRVKEGERLRVTLKNKLPGETTIHWHGIHQKGTNAMDGVPGLTQRPIPAGGEMVYDFTVHQSGSHFYHSHSGLDIERGLYAPLIVEPKIESLSYDREYLLVLDDWLDGSPDLAFEQLKQGISPADGLPRDTSRTAPSSPGGGPTEMGAGRGPMRGGHGGRHGGRHGGGPGGMGKMGRKDGPMGPGGGSMGAMAGGGSCRNTDIRYSTYLINGRTPEAAPEFAVKRGERVRFRTISTSGATVFRVAIAGHKLTITHSDGYPVRHVTVDAFEISPGERYDFLITADNPGVWPMAAVSSGEPERAARAILRYTDARGTSPPPPGSLPEELNGRLLDLADLMSPEDLDFPMVADRPDRIIDLSFRQNRHSYKWGILGDGGAHGPFGIHAGERVRVRMSGGMGMGMGIWHPMHLHGHSFRAINRRETRNAPVKDTVLLRSMMHGRSEFEFLANNPGDWLFHCHHAYHLAAGMECVFKYV